MIATLQIYNANLAASIQFPLEITEPTTNTNAVFTPELAILENDSHTTPPQAELSILKNPYNSHTTPPQAELSTLKNSYDSHTTTPPAVKPESLSFTKKSLEPLNIPIPSTITLLNYLQKQGDARRPSRFEVSKYHRPNAKYTKKTKFGPKHEFDRLTAHRTLDKFHGQTSRQRMFYLSRFLKKQEKYVDHANRLLKNL